MPYAVPVSGPTNTSQGTPWNYDAQVPLVFWGGGLKPGFDAKACQPIDMAATLAAILGLPQPSGTEATPLASALKWQSTKSQGQAVLPSTLNRASHQC